jgi:hypothetical protein
MLKTTAPTRIYLAFLTKKRVEGIYEYAAFDSVITRLLDYYEGKESKKR